MERNTGVYWWPVLFLCLLKFISPLIVHSGGYELQRDELLYFQQGQHLAAGYIENPPFLSWLAAITSYLGGDEIILKGWSCLFGAFTLVLTCMITAELRGRLFAQVMAGLGILSGAYVRIHYLFQPNFLDIFAWTLIVYFSIRLVKSGNTNYLFGLAAATVFGWWSKYSVLFIVTSLLISMWLSGNHRLIFNKKTSLAVIGGLCLIAPNLWWQYSHNWPLAWHMQELQSTQLKYNDRTAFLTEQFMQLMPAALLWCAGIVWVLQHKSWRYIGYTYLLVTGLLLLAGGKGYYSLGIYPVLIGAGAVAWEQFSFKRIWIRYIILPVVIGLNLLIMPFLLPIWPPEKLDRFYKKAGLEHKWEDQRAHPLPQDYADMLGWKEMADKTNRVFNKELKEEIRDSLIIYCSHYGQAGSLLYYSNDSYLKKKVISGNGSFLGWIPDSLRFRHILFIGRKMPDKDEVLFQHFRSHTLMDSVTNPWSRQYGDKIILFENADSMALPLARDRIQRMKRRFNF